MSRSRRHDTRPGFVHPLFNPNPSQSSTRENHMRRKAKLEKKPGGWWAIQSLGKDNILGHGRTKEEALVALEHQVTGFVNLPKKTGRIFPESLR
jgi:hypothetical protein